MSAPVSKDSIARAMQAAAWTAKHGRPEERAGRFIAPAEKPPEPRQAKR